MPFAAGSRTQAASQAQTATETETETETKTKLMYFSSQEFSPRYGDQFFTQRFLPLPCADEHGTDTDTDTDTDSDSDSEASATARSTVVRKPKPPARAQAHEVEDSMPPGSTHMWAWILRTLVGGNLHHSCIMCPHSPHEDSNYRIEIRRGIDTWVINKQYSDFVVLLQDLHSAIPSEQWAGEEGTLRSGAAPFGYSALLPPPTHTSTCTACDAGSACSSFSAFVACSSQSFSSSSRSKPAMQRRHAQLAVFLDNLLLDLCRLGLLDVNNVVRRFCQLDATHREAVAAAASTATSTTTTTRVVE